jgi:hypothetical protein
VMRGSSAGQNRGRGMMPSDPACSSYRSAARRPSTLRARDRYVLKDAPRSPTVPSDADIGTECFSLSGRIDSGEAGFVHHTHRLCSGMTGGSATGDATSEAVWFVHRLAACSGSATPGTRRRGRSRWRPAPGLPYPTGRRPDLDHVLLESRHRLVDGERWRLRGTA